MLEVEQIGYLNGAKLQGKNVRVEKFMGNGSYGFVFSGTIMDTAKRVVIKF